MKIFESLKKLLPIYETTLPFSKKTATFTPFKVKDIKNITVVLQEDNKKLALLAMVEMLKENVQGVNILDLCLADAEYLFLQIRSKSVDEKLNLIYNKEKVSIFIPHIKHKNEIKSETIELSKDITMVLETPTIKDLIKLESFEKNEILKSCIKKLISEGEIFYVNKFVPEEVKTLIDNLPINFLSKLENFLKEQPDLVGEIETSEGKKEVSGILTFFSFR